MSETHPTWIDAAKVAVLAQLSDAFDAAKIPWMAVGGLAGNLWGSSWPLNDLDFDVPTERLPDIASRWAAHVFWHGRYVDDEFDIELVRMRVGDVEVSRYVTSLLCEGRRLGGGDRLWREGFRRGRASGGLTC